MAVKEVLGLTGYIRGGVSPVGTKKAVSRSSSTKPRSCGTPSRSARASADGRCCSRPPPTSPAHCATLAGDRHVLSASAPDVILLDRLMASVTRAERCAPFRRCGPHGSRFFSSCHAAIYSPALHFAFLNYDDHRIRRQPARPGRTDGGVRWLGNLSTEGANWFPLTRLSHLLDVQLFGIDSGCTI